jgi:hypothetical protein
MESGPVRRRAGDDMMGEELGRRQSSSRSADPDWRSDGVDPVRSHLHPPLYKTRHSPCAYSVHPEWNAPHRYQGDTQGRWQDRLVKPLPTRVFRPWSLADNQISLHENAGDEARWNGIDGAYPRGAFALFRLNATEPIKKKRDNPRPQRSEHDHPTHGDTAGPDHSSSPAR